MEVEELYHHLLHLAPPWTVRKVVAEAASARVLVYLALAEGTVAACPHCGEVCAICGQTEQKSWRHLNTCQRQTQLFASLPLVDCPEHGEQSAAFLLAEAEAPVTFAFAQWVRQLAKSLKNVKRLAAVARLDPDLVERILSPSEERSAAGKTLPVRSSEQSATGTAPEPPKQLGLFTQNDMILINQGLRALKMLQPEQALDLFRKHRQIYPKGPEVASKIALAEFLLRGMAETPLEPVPFIQYRCGFWNDLVDHARAHAFRSNDRLLTDLQKAYFESTIRELEQAGGADAPMMAGDIPSGYLYLQAGQVDRAIRHLQALIPQVPDHAALYGYLGDAYWLRGEVKVARQCYREGCLIAPATLDWHSLKDDELRELLHDLQLLYGFDKALAAAWLPSHARVAGLFEHKALRPNEGLKELVNDYLTRQKALAKRPDPIKAAELFFRAMILCENEESLRLVKKVDLIQIRRLMKQTSPDLFAEFLATVVAAR